MVKTVYCIALVTLSSVLASADIHPLSDEYINNINNQQSLWKAGRNFASDTPISQLKSLLSVKTNPTRKEEVKRIQHVKDIDIPDTFDARTQWPTCASIKEIGDQSACSAGWAVITSSCMSDRLCIASNGTSQLRVSAVNLLACLTDGGFGCDGGVPYEAWVQWAMKGIVTGGLYNNSVGCQNFPFPSCEHHGNETNLPECASINYETPDCVSTCDNSSLSYTDSLTYGKKFYLVNKDPEQIQLDILKNGPVSATFVAYPDFFSYKTGIYRRTTAEDRTGIHSAKILGWGVENNVSYWLAANSWNSLWGDNGFFKILRGVNECQFEDDISAGIPDL